MAAAKVAKHALWERVRGAGPPAEPNRRARHRGDSELTAFDEAADMAKALGRPIGTINDAARVLIDWAAEHHRDWFYKFER